jgi:AcrR family transcriptional regulator
MDRFVNAPIVQRSARKARGDGHLRRAEILAAAERIFVAEGYEGATIRRIAQEVGVSSTALYLHFEDKSRILLEICERALHELLANNAEIAGRPLDARVRVRLMVEAYVRWGLAHPNAYQLVYLAPRPLSAGGWPDDTVDISTQCYKSFSSVVREIAAEGRLNSSSAGTAAQAIWMAAHGVTSLLTSRPDMGWAEADDLIRMTFDNLLGGLFSAHS